ncbi:rRNA processing protein Rrp7 [Schizosaccharomyces pombe]
MDKLKEKGFVKLEIYLENEKRLHSIFLKEDTEDVEKKSLYLINVPITTTEKILKRAISQLGGRIVNIYPNISGLLKSGTHLRVKLVEPAEVKQVIKAASKKTTSLPWKFTQHTGLKRYVESYDRQFVNPRVLAESVDSYMKRVTKKEIAEKRRLFAMKNQPDEDGFVTVVRSGRAPVGRPQDAERQLEKKKDTGIHKDFYRFQLREKKKKALLDLAHKFEFDKQRIQQLKEKRQFKPY